MDLNERIYRYLEFKGITPREMEVRANLSNGAVSKMGNGTRRSTIDKISNAFPDLNIPWLLTGEGDMLIGDTPITNNGTNQQVAQNVRGHVTQSVTTDLATTISELTEIIKQSQAIASTSQEIAITAQRQLNSTLNQLTESQNQITTLIDLINRQQDK